MRDIEKRTVKGSSVVEMAYIMPMFLALFVLIVHTVFYYHDKAVLMGAAAETAVLGTQTERREGTEYDLEEFFRERIRGKLIYMTDVEVSAAGDEEKTEVTAYAQKSFMKLEVCQRALVSVPEKKIRWMR